MLDQLLSTGTHSRVLDAMQKLLTDGSAASPEDLCARGIAAHLLPPETIPKYVYNALVGSINRDQLRGARATFVELADGTFRLNVPLDPFASFALPEKANGAADAIIRTLNETSRSSAPGAGGNHPGGAFEDAVAQALSYLDLSVKHDGRQGEPDIVAAAPLGSQGYVAVFECKSAVTLVGDADVTEPARFRDRLKADYAVLIGPQFAGEGLLDDELRTHGVALWTVADLIALVRAHTQHPIRWSDLRSLVCAGRQSQAIADFAFEHLHGARKRALTTWHYAMEEGLKYQRSLLTDDPLRERVNAPLTVESLALLVNERLAAELDEGRASVDDVRAAVALASHPAIGVARVEGNTIWVEASIAE